MVVVDGWEKLPLRCESFERLEPFQLIDSSGRDLFMASILGRVQT